MDTNLSRRALTAGVLAAGVFGAVPAIGKCYGLDLIVDDSINAPPDIYMEAGDHQTLLHLSQAQFARLTANEMHGRFSTHA